MHFSPDQPFNTLPDLPPQPELETPAVLKATTRASRAVAELKGRSHSIPNPTVLLNTLALQEAKISSEIENIFTTNDELFRGLAANGNAADLSPHAKEVLHYRDALWHGVNELRKRPFISTNLAIEIVNIITENSASIRDLPGTKLQNPDTKEVIYTPPDGEDLIRRKMANLETFCNNPAPDPDPLVRAAVAHYQFEAIHPFFDGNGRTGRILIILQLVMNGLLEIPILFLSKFIIEHKTQYYRNLRAITERGDWQGWLIYMLEAIENTAQDTTHKISAIRDLLANTIEQAKRVLPKPVFSKELIELIFEQPYCKIRFVEAAGIAKRLTATKYLRELEKAGFVVPVKRGTELIFVNHHLWRLLTNEPLPQVKTESAADGRNRGLEVLRRQIETQPNRMFGEADLPNLQRLAQEMSFVVEPTDVILNKRGRREPQFRIRFSHETAPTSKKELPLVRWLKPRFTYPELHAKRVFARFVTRSGESYEGNGEIRVRQNPAGLQAIDLVFTRHDSDSQRTDILFHLSSRQLQYLHRAPADSGRDFEYDGVLSSDDQPARN